MREIQVKPILTAALTAAAACTAVAGCNRIVKDTKDLTLPGVVMQVRGADGRFHPATEATLPRAVAEAGAALEISCEVADPGGISKVTISFEGRAEACLIEGAPAPPSAEVRVTGLPRPQTIALADDSAAARDRLRVTAQLPGALGCQAYVDGALRTGVPRGRLVEVRCTGENWSVNPSTRRAHRRLDVALAP